MNYLKSSIFAIFTLGAFAMTSCDPKDNTIDVTGVEITSTPDPLILTVGGEAGKITAKVLPADATNQEVNISVDKSGVVEIAADGTVTAVASGTATITAIAANGVKKTCDVTVVLPESIVYNYTGTFTVSPGTDSEYVRENSKIVLTINPDRTVAEMIMVQARFTPQGGMPEMDITVPGVTVTQNADGYSISGEGIIPIAVMQGQPTPFPQFTMTEFTGTATETKISWDMMCGQYPLTFTGTVAAE
jgi:hypothetical protein